MKLNDKKSLRAESKKIYLVMQIPVLLMFFVLLTGTCVSADIIAGFAGVQTSGPAPLTVTFIDQSISTENITGYLWNFGDGSNNSTEKNPNHTYMGKGRYNVSLRITDKNGLNNTTIKAGFVNTQPSDYPVVKFSATPGSGTVPQTVVFLDQSVLDPAVPDEMYNYIWNFGDGTNDTSNSRNIQHKYTTVGKYGVKLQIQDQNGYKYNSADPVTVNITNGTPKFAALFTAIPSSGPAPLLVSFIDQSTSPVAITNYSWNFGDGSTNSTEKNPSHTYIGVRKYNVTLTITDADGKMTTTEKASYVNTQPSEYPVVKFTAIPQNVTTSQTVYFIDQSELDPAVPDEMYNYFWDYGDGTTSNSSNSPNIQHKYAISGDYTAKLQIQDQKGSIYNAPVPVIINVKDQVNHIITATSSLNGTITPSGNVTVRNGADQSFSITPDNGYNIQDIKVNNKSIRPVPVYIFYNVTQNQTINVNFTKDVPLAADFTADKTSGSAPLKVRFIDSSTGHPDSWFWTFGDGGTSDSKNPVHTYYSAGKFTVNLTVSKKGISNIKSAKNYINVSRQYLPTASFIFSPPIADVNEDVIFISDVSGPKLDPLLWDFGDGSSSVTGNNPVYQYQYPGNYSVTLTVTNPYGMANATGIVPVRGLIPDFEISPEEWAVVNTPVTFRDTSKGSPSNWVWDFGDGNTFSTSNNVTTHTYTKPGIFRINMTATNWESVSASKVKEYTILVNSVPRYVNFTVLGMNLTGKAPFTVQFKDTTPVQSNVSGWLWEFGDGTNSVEKSPTHTYTVPGQYTVILTVLNDMGTNEARKAALIAVT
jgi:PKD repeat protein